MPEWDEDRLKLAITNREVGAISLDTSVFDQAECNLNWAPFASLSKFQGTGIEYLLTDVVGGEVRAHIAARAGKAATQLRAATREYGQAWRHDALAAVGGVIDLSADVDAAAQSQLEQHTRDTGAILLKSASLVDIDKVLESYFSGQAPFETTSEKKHEFPDALALSSLDAWGEKHGTFVLVISRDKGWQRFAANSAHVVCFSDFRKVLGLLNEEDTFIARRIIAKLNSGDLPHLADELDQELTNFVDGLYPHVEANSGYLFESEFLSAALLDREAINIESVAAIDSADGKITISFDVYTDIEAEASFQFFVKDEGDEIPIGSTEKTRTICVEIPFTMVVTRDPENPEFVEVEASEPRGFSLDFGYIEPNWREEYED